MSASSLKQLFLVAFLGLTLVGCSSTPTTEDSDSSTAAETTTGTAGSGDSAASSTTKVGDAADAKMAEPTNAAGMTAAQLLAALQGKVVNFDFDRSEIKSDFYKVIKLNADYMSLNTSATVTIKGYCDERGTPEYNLALGERRAKAVKNALIAEGVSPSRINIISYGEENPIDPAHTEAAWAKNRRAEFSY